MKEIDIQYREIRPAEDISDLVLNHWVMHVNHVPEPGYPHHIIPDGCVSFVYQLGPNAVSDSTIAVGPRLEQLVVPLFSGVNYVGSRLRPEAVTSVSLKSAAKVGDFIGPIS